MIVIDRPVGPHRDRERMIWDLMHPDAEEALRQLDELSKLGLNPLVSAVDAKQAAFIATQASTVLRRLMKQDRVAGDTTAPDRSTSPPGSP